MTETIAIIGAGLAGLTAARKLNDAGCDVVVFEKSRGLGGRMATRRQDGFAFDHGAQYFTARTPQFQAVLDTWLTDGAVAEWGQGRYVGMPGMTAPCRTLGDGLVVERQCEITWLAHNDGKWTLGTADGPNKHASNGAFSTVILAVPAPQAEHLVATSQLTLDGCDQARYAPCLALMAAFPQRLDTVPDFAKPDGANIGWFARNASKPGRDQEIETFVVHATPAWSEAHLEWERDEIARALLAEFQALTGIDQTPDLQLGHRWRYALVKTPVGRACLWNDAVRLGGCGDWCLGARVECAFESGNAMAETVLART
ncbi:MAG: FAD-dependent oxidoreductase [Pseudomonadota bacterium]